MLELKLDSGQQHQRPKELSKLEHVRKDPMTLSSVTGSAALQ